MKIPEEFYREEVRCDYTISADMKKVWAAELEIYSVFKDVCDRHGIRYFFSYGNLLGAAMGLSRIPPRYLENLEAADVILEMAEDLLQDCPISEYHPIDTPQKQAWYRKYVEGRRA
jgi:hypothetical protein